MEIYPDGESYIFDGQIRLYNPRPCGARHSLKLICAPCVNARERAKRNRSLNPIIPHLRDWIFERDGYKCVECEASEDLTVDHILPVILGGTTDPDNLQTLCRSCNSSKGSREDF